MKNAKKVQILTLGDGKVGKTSILKRYNEDAFTSHHLTTIGIDFITKDVRVGNDNVTVKIWDTAGQERFRTITHTFYKQAEGVLLVFDVTDRMSYENLHAWVNSIHEHADEKIIKYLIANKIDLSEERKVSKEEGQKMANQYKMKYFETSAKSNINITESIESLVKDIYETSPLKEDQTKLTVTAHAKSKANAGGCCGSQQALIVHFNICYCVHCVHMLYFDHQFGQQFK
eukprot:TRINITY_DN3733_c0_g1_i1.p1 TRINITY_DN3733_c0_g1~~TRINITY_DN3733_c0_g1_i1.p1  ORF type:complete len:230 (+),score=20.84 TRINITY_DN3733_c0_g1_i1:142-831(+)